MSKSYVWDPQAPGGIGGLLEMKNSAGAVYSYLYDGRGNVTGLMDSNQALVASYKYDPFGNLMVKTGTLDQPYQFYTKRYFAGVGLVYYGYRFYYPQIGRWINRDPLGEEGGMILYYAKYSVVKPSSFNLYNFVVV